MVEITLRVIGHSNAFHDLPGPEIVYGRERDNFGYEQLFKSIFQNRTRTLLSISVSPIIECQSPSNFRTGRKWKRTAR